MRGIRKSNETRLRCFQEKRMTLLPMQSFTHALSLVFPDTVFCSRKFYPAFPPLRRSIVLIFGLVFGLRGPLKAPVTARAHDRNPAAMDV
jgi:hypothetical protein